MPGRDLVASALRDISRSRVLDQAGVQAAWDRMAKGLAILLSQPGRWGAPENRLRGDVEWLLRAGAAQAKTFGRIDSITAEIVPSRGEPSAMIVRPIIIGTLRTECLRGNTSQILLWRSGDKVLYQTFVYGLDRPADWSQPFTREISQLTAWRWHDAMVLGVGSAMSRDGLAEHPEFLVLRQEKGRWVVRQRIASDEEGDSAWATDAGEVVLRTTAWPKTDAFSECRSCPHVYYDTFWKRDGKVFERSRRERVASPYAGLCDFTLALRRGDAEGAARLASGEEAMAQAKAARMDNADELTALTVLGGLIDFDADGKRFVAKMVERDGRWLVSSIEPRPAS